jgi:hypothetical protein
METNHSNMSLVTCSPYDGLTEFKKQVPTLYEIALWSPDKVHQSLGDALFGMTTNYLTAKNLIADIKRRLQKGEVIGGCKTWTSYVDTYIRKHDENLPVVIRRLYRQLDGEAVNPKHNGTANRKPKKVLPKKSNRVIVEEGIARQEYARGLADGKRMPADGVTPKDAETITETYYIRYQSKTAIHRHGTFPSQEAALTVSPSMNSSRKKLTVMEVKAAYVLTKVSE